jgi:uncharacterized membrane protein
VAYYVFDAILLISAVLRYVWVEPAAYSGNWPTFSRTLADGPFFHTRLLGGLASLGGFIGGLSIAAMMHQRAQNALTGKGRGFRVKQCLATMFACLSIVQYFLYTRTLTRNHDAHMLLSYIVFTGNTIIILSDVLISDLMRRLYKPTDQLLISPLHRRVGFSVFWSAVLFLITYVAKDMNENPFALLTQRIFTLCELAWIITAHVYSVLYLSQIRTHFGSTARASFHSR